MHLIRSFLITAGLPLLCAATAVSAQEAEPGWAKGRPKTDIAMKLAPVAAFPIPTAVDVGFDSGMWLIKQLAISRDGRSLYGLSRGDDAVDSFSRDPATGALGFAGLSSLAFAAGKLYATAGGQSAVSSFSVAGG